MSEDKSFEEVKTKVEATLFAYGDWLSPTEIMSTLHLDSEKSINSALKELVDKYKDGYPFTIFISDMGKYKMSLKEEFEDLSTEVVHGTEIPKPVLKVLSVIAYEQPITKTRLNEILGKSVKEEVDYLYKNKFLNYDKEGNGKYYRLTKKFYDYFNLGDELDFRSVANKDLKVGLEEPASLSEVQKNAPTSSNDDDEN